MIYLLTASLIWAFSFGLIKGNLTGLNPIFVSFVRLFISLLVFLPFFRFKSLNIKDSFRLILIGVIQYGVMYVTYIFSYQYLQAYEVALFTVFTPIYVTLLNDFLKKKFNGKALTAAVLAIIGTGIIVFRKIGLSGLFAGFVLLQISNLCFAAGQIFYKNYKQKRPELKDHEIFALLFAGGVIFTLLTSLFTVDYTQINLSQKQIFTLIYLGIVASGIGFYLWNTGAVKTKVGTLAVFNNLKIPLAVTVSLLFFGEKTNAVNLIAGGLILLFALIYIGRTEYALKTDVREKAIL